MLDRISQYDTVLMLCTLLSWQKLNLKVKLQLLPSPSMNAMALFSWQTTGRHEMYYIREKNHHCKNVSIHTWKYEVSQFLEMWISCGISLWIEEYVAKKDECRCWKILFWRGMTRHSLYSNIWVSKPSILISFGEVWLGNLLKYYWVSKPSILLWVFFFFFFPFHKCVCMCVGVRVCVRARASVCLE